MSESRTMNFDELYADTMEILESMDKQFHKSMQVDDTDAQVFFLNGIKKINDICNN